MKILGFTMINFIISYLLSIFFYMEIFNTKPKVKFTDTQLNGVVVMWIIAFVLTEGIFLLLI